MATPTVDKDVCSGCGLCAGDCPTEAITMIDNYPSFDESKCTNCNACVDSCPTQAIKAAE